MQPHLVSDQNQQPLDLLVVNDALARLLVNFDKTIVDLLQG